MTASVPRHISFCGDACGTRTRIASLRGWCPNRLDEGTVLAGTAGFEPALPVSKTGALATWLWPSILVIRAGLEPSIAGVKGLRPNLLDERTIVGAVGPWYCFRR